MPALASLPMYALPSLAEATDAWWAGLARWFRRAGLRGVPDRLARDAAPERLWLSPSLLFGQTCGYPLTHELAGRVAYVATPVYAVEGCDNGDYCSFVMVREDDPALGLADLLGRRAAVNQPNSQSGMSALRRTLAPVAQAGRCFAEVVWSGSHRDSLLAVVQGRADVCAVDCVSYALLAREEPAVVAPLRRLAVSPSAPGLPYITRAGGGDRRAGARLARLRDGLAAAFADPALAEARERLCLAGVAVRDAAAYARILELEREAAALGYPELR